MSDDINYIDLAEFREFGYLHEVNRLVLHPLGLAASIEVAKEAGFTMRLRAEDHENLVRELDGGDVTPGRLREILDGLLANGEEVTEGQHIALGGVWDYRSDPEGVVYGDDLLSAEKAIRVRQAWDRRMGARLMATGFMVQPVPSLGAFPLHR